jgi:lysozyme family protein
MAEFIPAYNHTARNEGGYANNPNDNGGETYAGISRKFWPNWGGWKYIDDSKRVNQSAKYINMSIGANQKVQALVSEFYKTNFWYPLNLQLINDQQLATNVYDFGVNAGIETAAKRLQQAANAVCGDLIVDGQIGSKTVASINKLNGKAVYDAFNQARKSYYDNIIARNPSQVEFRKSWYSRIVPYQA